MNDTDDYALVAFDSYTIDQSDSLYLSQTDDGVSPQLYPRSIDLEAGESIVLPYISSGQRGNPLHRLRARW